MRNSQRTAPQGQPLPRIAPRKGFAALPGNQQLVVCALVATVLLALSPGLLDPARMRSAAAVKDGLKPQRPASPAQFVERLEEHYALGWLQRDGAEHERRGRLALTGLQLIAIGIGAVAGRTVHVPPQQQSPAYRFGAAGEQPGAVRARAALARQQ